MAEETSKLAEWTKPSVVLAIVGYVALGIASYMSFDGRIAHNAQAIDFNSRLIKNLAEETNHHLDRMDDKLNQLVDREH